MALKRLRLFRGDTLDRLVESFIGYTDLSAGGGEQATYSGASVLVNNGAFKALPIGMLNSGVDLLDRSNPSAPKFIDDGTYAVTLSIVGDALTAGGYALGLVQMNGGGSYAYAQAVDPMQQFSVCLVAVATAGSALELFVENKDGVAARHFDAHNVTVVKF